MALGTDLRLFPIKEELFYVSEYPNGIHFTQPVTLVKVNKGRATLKTRSNTYIECNIQSRKICFTQAECSHLCSMLNVEWYRNKATKRKG